MSVAAAVRGAWPAPTLLGGTAFTTFPVQYLDALEAEYGIAGDDLEPISRFVASLAAGRPDLAVPGLVYRDGQTVRCNPFEIRGYADTVFDGWDLMDLRPYRAPGETPATVEETLSRMPQTRAIYTLFDHGFRIQPGTELREITPPEMLADRIKRHQAEHRWGVVRGLLWMARLAWDKLRP